MMKKIFLLIFFIPCFSFAGVKGVSAERCSTYVGDYNEFDRLLNDDPDSVAFLIISTKMKWYVEGYFGVLTGLSDMGGAVMNGLNSKRITAPEEDKMWFERIEELVEIVNPLPRDLMFELHNYCSQNPTDIFYGAIMDNLQSYM